MEVVTPDGEVIRTGMGAVPNSESWQDFRYGAGLTWMACSRNRTSESSPRWVSG